MKVLFFVSQPTSSPTISVHATLMRFLNRERVEVHVVYPRIAEGEPYRSAGTSVLGVFPDRSDIHLRAAEFGPVGGAPKWRLLLSAARALLPALRDAAGLVRYVRRNEIDVIHCEEGSRNAFYAWVVSRLTKAKCIVHFHSGYGSWMTRLSRFAVKHADAIIAVSAWTGSEMERGGVPGERIFPVLNGIDLSGWDPDAVDGSAVRREFGLEPGDPLVVMIAQLVKWKRQAAIVEAFRTVAARHENAKLLLVGSEVHSGPGSYTEEVERQIADAGLDGNVVLTGRRSDVRQMLAAADIFALPSVTDPCPLAVIEAMAMAKPVVAVATGGAPELVEDGRAGLIGPPDDTAQLAANLIALMDEPARAREMGQYARHHAETQLTAQRMADDVEAVYRRVTSAR